MPIHCKDEDCKILLAQTKVISRGNQKTYEKKGPEARPGLRALSVPDDAMPGRTHPLGSRRAGFSDAGAAGQRAAQAGPALRLPPAHGPHPRSPGAPPAPVRVDSNPGGSGKGARLLPARAQGRSRSLPGPQRAGTSCRVPAGLQELVPQWPQVGEQSARPPWPHPIQCRSFWLHPHPNCCESPRPAPPQLLWRV